MMAAAATATSSATTEQTSTRHRNKAGRVGRKTASLRIVDDTESSREDEEEEEENRNKGKGSYLIHHVKY